MPRGRENPETRIMKAIREALAVMPGVVVWRNNVGAYGPQGAKIFYGLAPGSADLVGVCLCDMLSQGLLVDADDRPLGPTVTVNDAPFTRLKFGRFFAIEVKNPDGHTDPERRERQERWAGVVRRHGGFYAIAESAQDAIAAVERCRRGEDG